MKWKSLSLWMHERALRWLSRDLDQSCTGTYFTQLTPGLERSLKTQLNEMLHIVIKEPIRHDISSAQGAFICPFWAYWPSLILWCLAVAPDQWCRHDRGQTWPGSSAAYWHLPHHHPPGRTGPGQCRGRLPSNSTSFTPSSRAVWLTWARGRRWAPWKPSQLPHGGWIPHWGEIWN